MFSRGERSFRFLFPRARTGRGREGGGRGEGESERAKRGGRECTFRVHSHPFDHSSSISDLDLECNSPAGERDEAKWLEEKENKVPGVGGGGGPSGRGSKKRLGIPDEKRADRKERVNREN